LGATFPLPFQPARTLDGSAAGGSGKFLVAAMYTPDYAGFAERLRTSCEQFRVPHVLHEVTAVHSSISVQGSPDLALTKPNYIRHLLERYRKPVLYVDTDCVFWSYPSRIDELIDQGANFAIYNWLADAENDAFYPIDVRLKGRVIQDRYFIRSHRVEVQSADQLICSGCVQLFDTSPAAAALLARWHDTIAQHPRAPDDQCLDVAFNSGGAGMAGLHSAWLPKEYARVCWWILTKPVIDHPQFPSLAPGFERIPAAQHLRLERCTASAPRLPKQAVIDVEARQLYELADDWLMLLGPLGGECWVAEGNRTTKTIDVAGIETPGA